MPQRTLKLIAWRQVDSLEPQRLPRSTREIGILLPNNQRQHRTLHIQKDALRIVLVAVPRVSRSFELFQDGFDLHLLQRGPLPLAQPLPSGW